MKFLKRILLPLLLLMALGVVGVVGFIGWLWVQHDRPVAIPRPSGPYAVGRVEYEWTDPARIDTLSNLANQKRRLMVWIWYPAAPASEGLTAPYLPAAWLKARQHGTGLFSFLTQNLSQVRTNSFENARLAPNPTPFPVLVMQPGLGPLITDYSTLAEALASQGYIVVGSNPTYSANIVVFQDGTQVPGTPAGNVPDNASLTEAHTILDRLITVWAADDRFILDQLEQLNASDPSRRFTGKLDMQKVGLFGHSFGGATAAQVCDLDSRCKAGVDIDGYPYGSVVRDGLHQPFMFIWSEPPDSQDAGWQQAVQDAQAIDVEHPHPQYELMIKGMRHFNFSDQAVLFSPVIRLMGGLGAIDGRRGLEITIKYVQSFFDRYLKQINAPLLDGPSSQYPEVHIRAH
jgi:predicted dienelactone hydrolase